MEKKYVPLKFDKMFKKIFANNEKSEFLKFLLEETIGIKANKIKILNVEIISEKYSDKNTTVDLIVEVDDDYIINVEVNTDFSTPTMDRNFLYMSRIISSNIKAGEDYSKLKNSIQINFNCSNKRHNIPIKLFKFQSDDHESFTNKLEIYVIDVPYFVEKCYNGIEMSLQDKLIALIGIDDKKFASELTKGDKIMADIFKSMEEFTDDEMIGAYNIEEERMKMQQALINDARTTGIEQGIVQGIEQGIEKEKNSTILNMYKKNIDIETISEVTGKSIEYIQELLNK